MQSSETEHTAPYLGDREMTSLPTAEEKTGDTGIGSDAPTKGLNRSVSRALDLLRDIAKSSEPISFTDLQKRHGIAKGTLHNLLTTLEAQEFIRRDLRTGRYLVGFSVIELVAAGTASVSDLGRVLAPVLEPLVERCRETCHLGILNGFDELLLRRIDHPSQIVRIAPQVERRHPAHATSGGIAALALLDDSRVESLLPKDLQTLTPNTISTSGKLFERLHKVRADGYSLDMEEAYLGVRCVAVATEAPGWQPVTISFTLPLQRAPIEHLVDLAAPLKEAAKEIRTILSITPPS